MWKVSYHIGAFKYLLPTREWVGWIFQQIISRYNEEDIGGQNEELA